MRYPTRFFQIIIAAAILVAPISRAIAMTCDQDRPKVCGGITPGDGRVHACMIEHVDELSPKCAKTVRRADELGLSFESVCGSSIQQFCAQYSSSGRPRMAECIASDVNRLTPDCRRAVQEYQKLNYRLRE